MNTADSDTQHIMRTSLSGSVVYSNSIILIKRLYSATKTNYICISNNCECPLTSEMGANSQNEQIQHRLTTWQIQVLAGQFRASDISDVFSVETNILKLKAEYDIYS